MVKLQLQTKPSLFVSF